MTSGADSLAVLYIVGWGRSGSTILDNLLGAIDGFFSAGELRYLWERGFIEHRLCGCGEPLLECPIWSKVLDYGWGSGDKIEAAEIATLQRRWTRVRDTRKLLRSRAPFAPELQRLVDVTGRLYRSIAEVTGARVIVDSSKRPSDAALLRLIPGVTARFVQLVRDPRAVAYSWQRRRAQPDRGRPAELVRHGSVDSTVSWVRWNLLAEKLRSRDASRSIVLRYEDFVQEPRTALLRVTSLAGEGPVDLPLRNERAALLVANHTVSGNPSRFTRGSVELRPDNEWVARQSRRDRIVSTALALPWLRRYGYPIRVA